jgi:DNA helicase INO80
MYKALQANVSIADLLEKAANIGDADSARSLMNLVMQFRKVRCLSERRNVPSD